MKSVFWFRRDLRLEDNAGLYHALKASTEVIPIFVFDSNILNQIKNKSDRRVDFIFRRLEFLRKQLQTLTSSELSVFFGDPAVIVPDLVRQLNAKRLYFNHDYEPYPLKRDLRVKSALERLGVETFSYKDHVIFEKKEILSQKASPYTVFTPYRRAWLSKIEDHFYTKAYPSHKYFSSFAKLKTPISSVKWEQLGFNGLLEEKIGVDPQMPDVKKLKAYAKNRNVPSKNGTSHLGVHLRFGTISVRNLVRHSIKYSSEFVSELIWRDFFSQILFNFPHVAKSSFRAPYDELPWINKKSDFEAWSHGNTGYPLVDAGIRELLTTGYMHNRVRMVVASFLCKHLLTHWKYGERFFAQYLNDYDMASNNGNWQWCASTGCDAAPYYRVFNPDLQLKKFDPHLDYVKKWVPEYGTKAYVKPIVDHSFARTRALKFFSILKAKA